MKYRQTYIKRYIFHFQIQFNSCHIKWPPSGKWIVAASLATLGGWPLISDALKRGWTAVYIKICVPKYNKNLGHEV